MNGGNPGIQTWTNKYKATLQVLQLLLSATDHTMEIKYKKEFYYNELKEMGVIEDVDAHHIKLNTSKLYKHSVVVSDELFDNMRDINWLREQRKKLGQIEGKVKGEEWRAAQQARRKKRRAFAKEQKAKRLAQPSEEINLSEIIFPD